MTTKSQLGRTGARRPHRQRGIALVFVLLMMVIAISAAVYSARQTLLGDKVSRNDRDRQVAFQSAELALNDAELDIMDADLPDTVPQARGCKFANPAKGMLAEVGCSADSERRGYCAPDPINLAAATPKPYYELVNWADNDDGTRRYVKFGEFTGRSSQLQSGGLNPAQPPKYIIVASAGRPQVLIGPGQTFEVEGAYKIYAIGYGVNKETQVILESEIYKPILEKKCRSMGVTP